MGKRRRSTRPARITRSSKRAKLTCSQQDETTTTITNKLQVSYVDAKGKQPYYLVNGVKYYFHGLLGAGAYGVVYKFKRSKEFSKRDALKYLAVKTAHDLTINFGQESKKWNKLYGDTVAVAFFGEDGPSTMIMPYVKGKPLGEFILQLNSFDKVMRLFIAAAKELSDYHLNKNRVHGDIKEDNINIRSLKPGWYQVGFVDLDYCEKLNRKIPQRKGLGYHFAPELTGDGYIQIHPSQDIYSLGSMFSRLLDKWVNQNSSCNVPEQLREIKQLTKDMQNENSGARPDIKEVLNELRKILVNERPSFSSRVIPRLACTEFV